jgi:tetratricopeptide (TPR) repeat protein
MRPLVAAAVLALALSPALATAQSADALIDEGIALREQHADAEALDRFERAQALEPSGRALAQIALAEQALGHFVDAQAHLEEALADEADRFIARNRELLEQALAEIAAHVGELEVRGPADAELRVDGAMRGRLPLAAPLRVEAGTRSVEVRATGHEPFAASVEVTGGARTLLPASLRPLPPPTSPEVATRFERERDAEGSPAWLLPTGIAAAAVGGVGLAIATGLLVVREDHAQARLVCDDADPACRGRYQAALDAEAASIATYVLSGTIAAAGVTLVLLDVLGIVDAETASDATIACAPGALSIACRGRF